MARLSPTAHDWSSTTGGTNASTAQNYGAVYNYTVPAGGYAPNGNLLAHSDSIMGDWAFQYGTLNRLTVMAPSDNVPGTFAWSLGCYAYDPFGNRTLNVTNYSWDDGCSGRPGRPGEDRGQTGRFPEPLDDSENSASRTFSEISAALPSSHRRCIFERQQNLRCGSG